MPPPAPDATLARLAAELRLRLPALVTVTVEQILDGMPMYRSGTPVPLDALRESVRANILTVLHDLAHPDALDLSQTRRTGRLRAEQGAPLPEVLRAFRIGFVVVWRALAEQVVSDPEIDPECLVVAAGTIWHLMDEYAEALTEEYRDVTAAQARSHEHHRSALVEALFVGGPVTRSQLWEIGYALDLPLNGTFLVATAETQRLGREALPGIERRLASAGHPSAWRLGLDVQIGVVSIGDVTAEAAVVAELSAGIVARLGISPVFHGLENTARARQLARAALDSMPDGRAEAAQFDRSPLSVLVASSPEAARQLADQVLGPLLDLPPHDRDVLLATLRAWFDHQGSTRLIAETLFCHPNTVRYRLRRICTELGRSLSDPSDIADLGAALRALRTLPRR